ncbi:Condensin complex subunit 3 [Entamoeba marina]
MSSISEEQTTLSNLFSLIKNERTSSQCIKSITDSFEQSPQLILQLTLCIVGLPVEKAEDVISTAYYEKGNFSNASDRLDIEEFLGSTLNVQPILKRLWRGVWKNVCNILRESSTNERKVYGKAIKGIHEIISSFSRSDIRNVRIGVVVAGVVMSDCYVDADSVVTSQLKILKKGRKKGKKQEIDRIEKTQRHIVKLLDHLSAQVLFPRVYDVSREIRRIVSDAVLHTFDDEYEKKKEIVDNLLYDDDSLVRKTVLKRIMIDFQNTSNPPDDLRVEFARTIKERVLEMKLDTDIEVSKQSIELCEIFEDWGLITESDRKEIYRLLCDTHSKIRKQTANFISKFFDKKISNFIAGNRSFVIKDKGKLRYVLLVRLLIEMIEKETDLPNFAYFSLEYILPLFSEFEDVEMLLKCIVGKESLALFKNEDASLYEGHESILLTMIYTILMRLTRSRLTSDEVLNKLNANEKRKELDLHIDVTQAVINHLNSLYDVTFNDESKLIWVVRMCGQFQLETINTENNLNVLKNFITNVMVIVRDSEYDLLYELSSLLARWEQINSSLLQSTIVSSIVDESTALCNTILDDGMDDESVTVDPNRAMILLYHYIKIDNLSLLRSRIVKLVNRLNSLKSVEQEHILILHILQYTLLWDSIENTPHDACTLTQFCTILKEIQETKHTPENAYELLGICSESYFLFQKDITLPKKFFHDPNLEAEYLYTLWPVEALASALSTIKFSPNTISDMAPFVPKMNSEVSGKLKKHLVLAQPQRMELENDPIED